ncbi:hypothetical protein NSQ54_13910 [Alkalihalobacillus sp. FSL W8-0930]
MAYTLSFFMGAIFVVSLVFMLLKTLQLSIKLKLIVIGASVGIALAASASYLLFSLPLTLTLSVVLLILASLILATCLEREQEDTTFEWMFPQGESAFAKVASTEEPKDVVSEPMIPVATEEAPEPVLIRKQALTEVEVDESEELMTGRRRRIKIEE